MIIHYGVPGSSRTACGLGRDEVETTVWWSGVTCSRCIAKAIAKVRKSRKSKEDDSY